MIKAKKIPVKVRTISANIFVPRGIIARTIFVAPKEKSEKGGI